MMTFATADQEAGFRSIFPKDVDNLPLDDLKSAHELVRRTVEPNGENSRDEVA